jgi:phytanoyl-CoA hydroxylase
MSLTGEQIHHFRHSGYLKIRECLPAATVKSLKNTIARDIANEVEPVVRDSSGRAVRLSEVIDRDPIFLKTASCNLVLDPLESLLGPHIELIKNRHNHATLRPASGNREEGLHRDVKQWSRTIFTVIFYLEASTVENGATLVVPGSHHFPGIEGRLYDKAWTKTLLDQTVPVPMAKGGMLITDSMIMHGVGQNQTDQNRTSMTMGYHSVDELTDIENPKRILVRGNRPYGGNDKT